MAVGESLDHGHPRVNNISETEPTVTRNMGEFDGGISFITVETAPTNVVALEPAIYCCWQKSKLKRHLTINPELHTAIPTTLGIDLTKRLHDTWTRS